MVKYGRIVSSTKDVLVPLKKQIVGEVLFDLKS